MEKQGFSLVELSIVLVILGLLAGGILTGQNLIRTAEIRAVVTEFENYQTSMLLFLNKYSYYPGDMPNATDYWGSKGGDGANGACYTVEATNTATCNGDGGGLPGFLSVGGAYYKWSERLLFWQHLANAGMIEGQYTGVTDSTMDVYALTAGKNSPASRLSDAIWSVNGTSGDAAGTASDFPFGRSIIFFPRSNANMGASPLLAEEVWNIDTKMDDGLPGYGNVRTSKMSANNCSTSDDEATAKYNLQNTSNHCTLLIHSQ